MAYALLAFAVLALLGLVLVKFMRPSSNSLPKNGRLPPGPKPKPIVGNILDLPAEQSYLKLHELSKTYGPLMRLSVFGQDLLVISSEKVANDLLRDRGAIYSSRPNIPSVGTLIGNGHFPVMLPMDPAFPERSTALRRARKFGHQILGQSAVHKYSKTHDLESCRLILDLIDTPTEYETLFERFAASIVFRLGYGKTVTSGREYWVKEAVRLLSIFEHALTPGAYLCDSFPALAKLPSWIAPFKRYLLAAGRDHDKFYLGLQDLVRQEMKEGRAPPSFTKTFLEHQDSIGLSNVDGAWLIGSLYGAGTGTTSAILEVVLQRLMHHPEWQARLHAELDEQVGDSRLPDFEDLPNLPTVRAVVKEALRINPVGLPHSVVKDDTYGEYAIPAGATLLPNTWAIHRDPELYPDPETFNPDRWLSPGYPTYREPLTKYPNSQHYSAFGFGRRICPGMSLAERSLHIATARLAWACTISKKIDSEGREVEAPVCELTTDLLPRPKPFQHALKPRDDGRVKVLNMHLEKAQRADPLNNTTSYDLTIEED